MKKNILLIIDPQWDFIHGSLSVKGGQKAMLNLSKYIQKNIFNEEFEVLLTMDYHPYNHCSFKDNGGQWPVHCVSYTLGASLWNPLMEVLFRKDMKVSYCTKGSEKNIEAYSFLTFIHSDEEKLEKFVINMFGSFGNIYVAGIAGDYCVLETLKDMKLVHNKIKVLGDCVASIDAGKALTEYCKENNIEIV